MELASKSIGKVLKIFLLITIGLNGVGLITNYFYGFQTVFYEKFLQTLDQFFSLFSTLIMLVLYILYLVWLFKVHKDFNKLDQEYPISPGGALARVMVPFYNIWGLWNVYSKMAGYLKQNPETDELGGKLRIYVPIYYILLAVSRGFNQYLTRGTLSGTANLEIAWILSYAFDLVLTIVFVLMYNSVTSALQNINGIDREEEKEASEEIVTV